MPRALLHLHPVGAHVALLRLVPHRPGELDRPRVEQELLGQRGLARVRVGDDGEGTPPRRLLGDGSVGGPGFGELVHDEGEHAGSPGNSRGAPARSKNCESAFIYTTRLVLPQLVGQGLGDRAVGRPGGRRGEPVPPRGPGSRASGTSPYFPENERRMNGRSDRSAAR